MYNYVFLHENGICYTIYQSPTERTDLKDNPLVISIDTYEDKYLNSRWTGSEWDFRPTPTSVWNGTSWEEPVIETSVPFNEGTEPENVLGYVDEP